MEKKLYAKHRMKIWLAAVIILVTGCSKSMESQSPNIEDYLPRDFALGRDESQQITGAISMGVPLTLDDCVRIALAENPAIAGANEGINISREIVGQVRASYYPQITTSVGYRYWETLAFLPSGIPISTSSVIGPTDDWTASAKARYTIFDGGERKAQLKEAKTNLEAAKIDFFSAQQDTALSVHIAFYNYQSANESLTVAQKNLERAEEHLRLAMKRLEAGAALEADVLRAQVSVAEDKLALVRAQSLVRLSSGALNTSMGLPVETKISIVANPELILPPNEDSLQNVLEQAVHARPELSAALERINSARQRLLAAQSAYGPKLVSDISYGRRDTSFFPNEKDYSAGVSVEIPIFTGFLKAHKVTKAEYEILKQEADIKQQIQKIREEVWISFYRLKEAQEATDVSKILVKDAEESLRVTQKRYETGAGTITDLMDSQTKLAQAEAIRVESQSALYVACSMYKRATGILLSETKH